jgi:hypothetical protein
LDPEKEYLYVAEPRIADWRITRLPEGILIDTVRPYRNGLMIAELKTADGRPRSGEVELLSERPMHTVIAGGRAREVSPGDTDGGRSRCLAEVSAPGWIAWAGAPFHPAANVRHGACFDFAARPPDGATNLDPSGVRLMMRAGRVHHAEPGRIRLRPVYRHDAASDHLLRLPDPAPGRKLILSFSSKVPEHDSNGYGLSLRLNGEPVLEVQREGNTPPQLHRADLTPWAGQDVLVTFRIARGETYDWIDLVDPLLRIE